MIDTAHLYYKNVNKDVKKNDSFIRSIKPHGSGNGWTVMIKPSITCPSNDTSTINSLISAKEKLDNFWGENGIITRVDFAYDLPSLLKDDIKLHKLFISCMTLLRKGNIENIFSTSTTLPKNIKIKNGPCILTIYDCTDKTKRQGNTRIENRLSKLSISNNCQKQLQTHIKNYISEIDSTKKFISKVEICYVELLYNNWIISKYTMGKLHEFISVNNADILTRNILVEFLKKIQYRHNINNFIDRHRRNKDRIPFNFVTISSFGNLIQNIKKDMKKTSQI